MADSYNPLEEEGRVFISEDDLASAAEAVIEEIKKPKIVEQPRPRYQAFKRSNRTVEAELNVKIDDGFNELINSSEVVKKSKVEIPKTVKKLKHAGAAISHHPESAFNTPVIPLAHNANDHAHPYHPPNISPAPDHYTKNLAIGKPFTLGEAKKYDIGHLIDQSISGPIDSTFEVMCRGCMRKISKYAACWVLHDINYKDGSGSVDGPLCGDCWVMFYAKEAIPIAPTHNHLGRIFKLTTYDVDVLQKYGINPNFAVKQYYTCIRCKSCAMPQEKLIWFVTAETKQVNGPYCDDCGATL